MAKIRERIAYLEAQERAAEEKRERRNQLMRNDLNTQVQQQCSDEAFLPSSEYTRGP